MKKIAIMLVLVLAASMALSRAGETEELRDSSANIDKINLTDLQETAATSENDVKPPVEIHVQVSVPVNPHYNDQPGNHIRYESGNYEKEYEAYWAMQNTVREFEQDGFIIINSDVYKRGHYQYYFVIEYKRGHHSQPYPPQPYPPQPWPPQPNPGQMQTMTFNSGEFTFASDAEISMKNAVASLQKAGFIVFEQRRNFNSYTLVFQSPAYSKIEQYKSGEFTFQSEAKKAADECVAAFEARGMVVLEKNVQWNRFTVSYLAVSSPYPNPNQMQTLTFNSGEFTFQSEAQQSLNNATASLQKAGYAILEKRQNYTRYTLIFLAPRYSKIEYYKSGEFTFQSEAKKAANDCVLAFESQGMVVLEKNVQWTRFTVSYFNVRVYHPWQNNP